MGRIDIACRSCGDRGLESILDLGNMPLANSLPAWEDLGSPDPAYPLEAARCPACTLVQITESVPPDDLFRDYLYFSSFSDTLVQHAADLVDRTIATRQLGQESLAIEIASNDGYLLQQYVQKGVPVLGIEPARNIVEVAIRDRGVNTIAEFFGAELAETLAVKGLCADVIHANNVLAHVPDLNGFVGGIAKLLKSDGIALIEVPYLKALIDRCEFDTIYHEHLCYFSLTALGALFKRNSLAVRDVERLDIHGGSLRLHVGHDGTGAVSSRVRGMLADEEAWGVRTARVYSDFAGRVDDLRVILRQTLHDLKAGGKRIAAYGAAAKGAILLNYCGIDAETIDFVADRSTYKQGRYIPGVRIPVVAPDALMESRPDYCLLLAWNFADEIMRQQSDYAESGGRFIIPVPGVRIVAKTRERAAA